MQRFKAVIFDLYDTLTYVDKRLYEKKVNSCALLCKVEPEEFSRAWKSLVVESNLGKFPKTEDRTSELMRKLGVPELQDSINALASFEHRFLETGILLFEDAISTLISLRNMGLKLGLVTNASPSVRVVLKTHRLEQYLDCAIISSEVGFRKPDEMIYKIVLERLGINPQEGIFVGDGNDEELDGAHRLGIVTVWVKRDIPKYNPMKGSSISSVDYTVSSLTEVIAIVGSQSEAYVYP
jgi:putative hydrolase of the HAD superfamily